MFWMFLLTVNTILLIIGGMLFGAAMSQGETLWVYPFWLTEIMASYYWFALVYLSLKGTINKDAPTCDLQRYVARRAGNLFLLHIAEAWLLSLVFLPEIVNWPVRLIIAYPGTALITMVLPLALLPRRYRRWQKEQEAERVRPGKIRSWAMRSEAAQRFVERFPECKVFVFDHWVKNKTAACLFLHRAPRPEQAGLMEDVLLELPVDMKTKQPLESNAQSMRYIFKSSENSSSIYHLDEGKSFGEYDLYARLDENTLNRFDSQIDRFPSLDAAPFPLAIRNRIYEELL